MDSIREGYREKDTALRFTLVNKKFNLFSQLKNLEIRMCNTVRENELKIQCP